MNFGRKMMKAGVAAVAAIATLGAGGVASTAFAGGGGGNQPGTGGDLAAVQFWQYKDDASGAWGPATSLDSVRAAMNNAGVTLEGNGITKAQAALDQARTECETGFQRRHSGEGSGDCRVVAVGAVPAVFGGNFIYNGSGLASPTGTGGWYDKLKTAREAGFRFDPNDPNAEQRLARFIRANPEIVAAARERECKRRKTDQRNARQQRWRATTRSTGKAKAPAATHTPPLQDTLF